MNNVKTIRFNPDEYQSRLNNLISNGFRQHDATIERDFTHVVMINENPYSAYYCQECHVFSDGRIRYSVIKTKYTSMNIHERINFKAWFMNPSTGWYNVLRECHHTPDMSNYYKSSPFPISWDVVRTPLPSSER